MLKTIRNAWTIPDLRKKILYTILLLVIFRFGSHIPVAGIDKNALAGLMGTLTEGNSLFEFLNIFSGGALSQASIFAMGISPYINASIIMQLLTVAIPALERLNKEGDEGRKILNNYTRYATVVLGLIQAIGFYFLLKDQANAIANPSFMQAITIIITFTAGTGFLMWLGEQITEKGIGNGISMLIFAGIVSRGPAMVTQFYNYFQQGTNPILLIVIIVLAIAAVAFVVLINNAERRIPVQYAKKVVGRKMYGGQSSHIPLKVAMAGVIPIIFASSILAFPGTIANFIPTAKDNWVWSFILKALDTNSWPYAIMYFFLIIAFTFFYITITFNPLEVSNNLKKNGGFVPGIRPGRPTFEYINRITNRITLIGSLFLAVIAVGPILLGWATGLKISIGGTSLLIVVGVALETVKQMESQMLMRHYKGFLE